MRGSAEANSDGARREADEHREEAARDAAHVTAIAEQRLHELDLDTDRIWGERERIVANVRAAYRDLGADGIMSDDPRAIAPVVAAFRDGRHVAP